MGQTVYCLCTETKGSFNNLLFKNVIYIPVVLFIQAIQNIHSIQSRQEQQNWEQIETGLLHTQSQQDGTFLLKKNVYEKVEDVCFVCLFSSAKQKVLQDVFSFTWVFNKLSLKVKSVSNYGLNSVCL